MAPSPTLALLLATLLALSGCASENGATASPPESEESLEQEPAEDRQVLADFEQADLGAVPAGWEAIALGDAAPTRWSVVEHDGGRVLRAEAKDGASGLALPTATEHSVLTWRWRVESRATTLADERTREGDDFAARVLVTFASRPGAGMADALQDAAARLAGHDELPAAALAYVFARGLPMGTAFQSPYTERVTTLVVRGADDDTNTWYPERRDLAADFEQHFGGPMPAITGIQLLTDSDDAGGTACTLYDDLALVGTD
jgi:hypothetical protein